MMASIWGVIIYCYKSGELDIYINIYLYTHATYIYIYLIHTVYTYYGVINIHLIYN